MFDQADSGGKAARQFSALTVAAVLTAVAVWGFSLWALRHILEPFVLAVFLLLMVDGMAGALRDRVPGFPARAALPAALAFILAFFGLTIWLAIDNAGDFASQSGAYTTRINALLEMGSQRLGLKVTPTLDQLFHALNPARYAGAVAAGLRNVAEASVFVLIYLGFLIASRQGFAAKANQLFATGGERAEAGRVFARIRHGVESYVWIQTVVGVLITALSALLMWITGLSHIPFWCLIIFLANYIPAIGAAIGVLFPAVFGLVELDGLWRGLALLIGLEAVHFAVSHVVQPRMQGRSLNVDPLVVLLALAFWSVLWGVTGAFLSTPLTVMAMAILAEFKSTRPVAILLSGDGKPYADMLPGARSQLAETSQAPPERLSPASTGRPSSGGG